MTGSLFRSEAELVGWLQAKAPRPGGRLKLGIGDDAALVEVGKESEVILTSDFLIEGVHFLHPLHPPHSVGHRALARSLSDVAAMGGTPRFALVSLAISRGATRAWMEEFYAGVLALARKFRVALVGGDTAAVGGRTVIDVTLVGEVPRGRALRRSGALPADQIFVSGQLGLSALGFRLLRSPRARLRGQGAVALRAHLYPEPQSALGRWLAAKRLASALIDLSDGLSSDLSRLCEASGVGANLKAEWIPRPEAPRAQCPHDKDALDLALHGGEDYQLLFTVRPGKAAAIPPRFRGVPLRRIGEIRRSKGILLVYPDGSHVKVPPGGYDHFRHK